MSPDLLGSYRALVIAGMAQSLKMADLRAVIAKAIDDLDEAHWSTLTTRGYEACVVDGERWPCPSARVADDLRRAIEP